MSGLRHGVPILRSRQTLNLHSTQNQGLTVIMVSKEPLWQGHSSVVVTGDRDILDQ
jgi:hypothetical protein